ncbi:MAG TPA: hypothetical protein VF669_23820 [Tepidisphaeraceae bacterium]|jgi:uncharacterized delta-60 repeat protein
MLWRAMMEGLEGRRLLTAQVVGTFGFKAPYQPGYEADVAVTGEGKRLAVGTTVGESGTNDVFVSRHRGLNDLDGSFGIGGVAVLDMAGGADEGVAIAVGPDGKIVVAGSAGRNDKSVGFVARLNADGSIDSTFGTKGVVTLSLDAKLTRFSDVAVWNNKIVVSGSAADHIVIARLNGDGSVDSSYGTGGATMWGEGSNARAGQMAVTADGRVAVAGFIAPASGANQMVVLRYRATGVLDNRFSGDGVWSFAYGSVSRANAVDVDGSGRLTVAGMVTTKQGNYLAATRLTASGKTDKKFGGKGWVIGTKYRGELLTMTRQADGTLAAGGMILPLKKKYGLVGFIGEKGLSLSREFGRYRTLEGKPVRGIAAFKKDQDPYGDDVAVTNPKVTLEYGDGASDTVVQSDGKLVILVTTHGGFHLRRLNADGTPDLSFGMEGWSDAYLPASQYNANGRTGGMQLTLLSDGRFLVLATRTRQISPYNGCVVAKYTANGKFDPSFNSGEPLQINGGTDDTRPDSLQVAPNGNIIINITDWQGGTETHVLKPDGTETSLGLASADAEIMRQHPEGYLSHYFDRLFVDESGGYLKTGNGWSSGPEGIRFAVRYHADGTVDTTFGINGVRIEPDDDPLGRLQNDGSYLRQNYQSFGGTAMELVRHDAPGRLVESFGTGGHAKIELARSAYLYKSVVLPDGKIVCVANSYDHTAPEGQRSTTYIFRLNADGSLDASFGQAGKPIYTFVGGFGEPAIRGGKFVIALSKGEGTDEVVAFDL